MAYRKITTNDISSLGLGGDKQNCCDVLNVLLEHFNPSAVCAIAANIMSESHFNESITSPAGYQGVFQCDDKVILHGYYDEHGKIKYRSSLNNSKAQAIMWSTNIPGKHGRPSGFVYSKGLYAHPEPPRNCYKDQQKPKNCCWIYGCEFDGVYTEDVIKQTKENNLKYGVDGVLWTYFRCCVTDSHFKKRYENANKFADIINRVCGTHVKKITDFNPPWGNAEPWKGGYVCGETKPQQPEEISYVVNVDKPTIINTEQLDTGVLSICADLLSGRLGGGTINNIVSTPHLRPTSITVISDDIETNPSQNNDENGTVKQEVINITGSTSITTTEGRAKYIFKWFKQKGVPTNNILGILANMHRKCCGMTYPYTNWVSGRGFTNGGLCGFITRTSKGIVKKYNLNINTSVFDNADKWAEKFYARTGMSFSKKYKGKTANCWINSRQEPFTDNPINIRINDYPIPFDYQLQWAWDQISDKHKDYGLLKPIYTPAQASAKFHDITNKNRPDPDDRWDKHGEEILKHLRSTK